MSQFKVIAAKAPWYFLSNILVGLSGFILLPIYTKYLNPTQYGEFQTIKSIAEFLPLIISYSLQSAFSRLYFDQKESPGIENKTLFSTIYWFLLGWGCIIYFLSLVIAKFFIQDFFNTTNWGLFIIAFMAPIFSQLGQLCDSYFRIRLESKIVAFISSGSFLFSSLINVLMLVNFNQPVFSSLLGFTLLCFLPAFFYTIILIRSGFLIFNFNFFSLKQAFSFSLPLHVGAISSWLILNLDRLILSKYAGLATVGNFTVAVTISRVLYMLNDAISQIHGPLALDQFSKDPEYAKKELSTFLEYFIALLTIGYTGVVFFTPELIYLLMPPDYQKSVFVLPYLCAAFVISGIYRPYSTILSHFKLNWESTYALIAMTFFSVLLNLLFIPVWAEYAAAISKLLSTVIYMLMIIYFSRKMLMLDFNILKRIQPFAIIFAVSILVVKQRPTVSLFIFKSSIGLLLLIYYFLSYRKPIINFLNKQLINKNKSE